VSDPVKDLDFAFDRFQFLDPDLKPGIIKSAKIEGVKLQD
jgi:hypothetical protein